MTTDHLRGRRQRRRAAAARPPADAATRSTRRCSRSCSPTSGRPAPTRTCACSCSPRPTTWASRPAPTSARTSIATGAIRRMQLFADLYDEARSASRGRRSPPATAPASAAAPRSPSPATSASAARTCACASPAPALGVPVGPGPARHALRPLGRQVPAADLEGDRRRRGLPLGHRPQGRAGAADRGGGAAARHADRRAPAGVGQPDQVDAARVGRRRGPLAGRGRGPGRVAVRGPGPGLQDLRPPQWRSRSLLEIAHGDRRLRGPRRRGVRRRATAATSSTRPVSAGAAPVPARRPRRGRARPRRAAGPLSSPPTTAAPATSRASSAPTWPRAGSATTRRAAPATSRTWRRRRTSSASGSRRSTRSSATARRRAARSSSPAPSRSPRPFPTPRCGRPASRSTKGEEIDLGDVAELLAGCGYERVEQVDDRGQFAVRGGILDVFGSTEDQAARIELFGDEIESIRWFSTFTQRSLGEAERIELDPAAEIDPDHRLLAEAALADAEDGRGGAAARRAPADRPVRLVPGADRRRRHGDRDRRAEEELDAALDDHLTDVRAAIHDDDVATLYVEVVATRCARARRSA